MPGLQRGLAAAILLIVGCTDPGTSLDPRPAVPDLSPPPNPGPTPGGGGGGGGGGDADSESPGADGASGDASTDDDGGAVVGPDATVEPECVTHADCASLPGLGPCEEGRCEQGSCATHSTAGHDCCLTAADCDDGNAATTNACPKIGEACVVVIDPTACTEDRVFLSAGFDDGTLGALDAPGTSGGAKWTVRGDRAAGGVYSAHFGVAACPPPGPVICAPERQGAWGSASLRTGEIDIAPDTLAVLSFRVYLDLFAGLPISGPQCADPGAGTGCYDIGLAEKVGDQLRVFVHDLSGAAGSVGTVPDVVWSATALRKTTVGKWTAVAVDLSRFAGRTIVVELRGELGAVVGAVEAVEGAFVDDLRVATLCGATLCQSVGQCGAIPACASAECIDLHGSAQGICEVDTPWDCVACQSDTLCDDGDDCTADRCEGGACQWEPTCCDDAPFLGPLGFETPKLPAGFTATSTDVEVTWGTADVDPYRGARHLYLGHPEELTYDTGARLFATLETPPIFVEAAPGAVVATMALRLDTEWLEGGTPSEALPVDRLEVKVLGPDGAVPSVVLDSATLGGATLADSSFESRYWNVSVDLTPWRGETIRLRLEFDTGDDQANAFGGVFLDELSLYAPCELPADGCWHDGECPADGGCAERTCWLGQCKVPSLGAPICCAEASECGGNACVGWACLDGVCLADTVADAACCDEAPLPVGEFEAGLGGFEVFGADGAKARWYTRQAAELAADGVGILFFNDPETQSYDEGEGNVAWGRALSPRVQLLDTGTPQLGLLLHMSTEHDEDGFWADSLDKLSIYVQAEDGTESLVWDSGAVGGSTGGAFIPVEVPLTAYVGQAVRFVFEFDSGDDASNAHSGVRIDAARIFTECP